MLDAAERALAAGRPFNRFVTILWEKGGIGVRDNARTTGAFVKLASDWARRHGYRLPWAWVQEWGPINGAHVHMLLHVRPDIDPLFRPMPLRWVKGLLPGGYVPAVLQSQKIAGARSHAIMSDAYRANLDFKLHYMMKAAPLEVARQVGLSRCDEAGLVFGKRAGVWQASRTPQ